VNPGTKPQFRPRTEDESVAIPLCHYRGFQRTGRFGLPARIARIDPQSGAVTGWLELKGLFPRAIRRNREAVLNGIAWDARERRLYVTGKLWPSLFEITWEGLSGGNRRQKLKTH